MPRNKRGGGAGGGGGARRGNFTSSRGGRSAFISFAGSFPTQNSHGGFTLQDEARNTERHHSFADSGQKLRHAKVNFVSAGNLTPPDIVKDSEEAMAAMSLEPANLKLKGAEQAEDAQMADEPLPTENETDFDGEDTSRAPSSFVIDTIGSKPVQTGLSAPRLRSTSPAGSDSSEEVILFHGRGQSTVRTIETRDDNAMALDPIDAKLKIVEDKLHEQQILLEETLRDKEELFEAYPAATAEPSSPNFESILPKNTGKGRRRGRARGRRWAAEDAEDEMIADYIANMEKEQSDGEVDLSFNRRELGGDLGSNDEGAWQDASSVEADGVLKNPVEHGWGRAELEDLDDLSTSDEARGKVQAILSKRERAAGLQYLIVWEDQSVDEARWVSLGVLHDVGALPLIEVFEAEEKLVAEFEDNSEDDSDESDDGDEGDDIDDEADLVQRRIDRMDDEQIARILAKQEELGMGGDEILLLDDDVDDEDDEIEARPIDLNSFILSGKRGMKGKQRRQGEFPRAAALADAYDGFDVMDFDRPALKKKSKGRKGKLILDDVSDSELEASMQAAWENDRIKKKARKQEREVLRAQGLLTGKHGKPDLKAKYKEGMGLHAMKEELKQFLMSDNTTLALPPMDKMDRKVVHEIANAFKLKSKSAGNGAKRYPILYRTTRTTAYIEHTFDAVEARLSRRFLPRNDVGGRRSGATPRRSGRGGSNAGVSYRDGDIVGGSAPELGVENKGRAMLEKMGWSSGTALGALNNKGILQPVSHVVKTKKAGLG